MNKNFENEQIGSQNKKRKKTAILKKKNQS